MAGPVDKALRRVEDAMRSLTPDHRRVVEWMATPAFREHVAAHREACAERLAIYFRPTDRGLVRIALHPRAPRYVGFRTSGTDKTHRIPVNAPVQTVADLKKRVQAFERWLPMVHGASDEERGVIAWLRRAIGSQLRLPELGEGWSFLHHEWRFADTKKADVLAVHVATGQLGIVELKAEKSDLSLARTQVDPYASSFERDAAELGPFFTALARAMGAAYGNDELADVTVRQDSVARFVGVASPARGVTVLKR